MKDSYFSSGGAVTWGHRREPGTDGQQRELGGGEEPGQEVLTPVKERPQILSPVALSGLKAKS